MTEKEIKPMIAKAIEKGNTTTWLKNDDESEYESEVFEEYLAVEAVIELLISLGIIQK